MPKENTPKDIKPSNSQYTMRETLLDEDELGKVAGGVDAGAGIGGGYEGSGEIIIDVDELWPKS